MKIRILNVIVLFPLVLLIIVSIVLSPIDYIINGKFYNWSDRLITCLENRFKQSNK